MMPSSFSSLFWFLAFIPHERSSLLPSINYGCDSSELLRDFATAAAAAQSGDDEDDDGDDDEASLLINNLILRAACERLTADDISHTYMTYLLRDQPTSLCSSPQEVAHFYIKEKVAAC